MMKNINWKKYAGATMAAAMIPAMAAPIATEAASVTGEMRGLHNGWNIKVTENGKPANHLFAEKQIYLVGQTDNKVYNQEAGKDKVWVPAGQTYDIYDVTNTKKGQITVYPNGGTTVANLNYEKVGVTFYQDGSYQGRSATFTEEGFYGEEALKGSLDDNTISSIKIPEGYTVTLFEHYEGTGLFITLTEDTDLPEYFEDIFSSFKIEKSEAK